MFGLIRRLLHPDSGDWAVWSAAPTRTGMTLARRWGTVSITKVSDCQFNVYKLGSGFLVTMQSREDGTEVEVDGTGLFKGGRVQSVTQAYERMASYLTDIIIASAMIGGSCSAIVVIDTTPSWRSFHLSTLRLAANGGVTETRFYALEMSHRPA